MRHKVGRQSQCPSTPFDHLPGPPLFLSWTDSCGDKERVIGAGRRIDSFFGALSLCPEGSPEARLNL